MHGQPTSWLFIHACESNLIKTSDILVCQENTLLSLPSQLPLDDFIIYLYKSQKSKKRGSLPEVSSECDQDKIIHSFYRLKMSFLLSCYRTFFCRRLFSVLEDFLSVLQPQCLQNNSIYYKLTAGNDQSESGLRMT